MTPGRPAVRRLSIRHRSAAGAAVLSAALAAGVLAGAPAEGVQVRAAETVLHVDQVAAASQCAVGPGKPQRGSLWHASNDLMAGHVDLDEYGSFHLAPNPTWKPVSSLDSSGRGHMHSLHWLLPLLKVGERRPDPAKIDRFYAVLHDWVHDNKPGGRRTSHYAWNASPIYEGFRSLTMVCAAAGPRGTAPWLAQALKKQGEMAADSRRYEGVNNASLHQQMGLYAIGAVLGRPAWRQLAIQRIRALVIRLIHPDGSDEEGALTYAQNDYKWFRMAADRMQRAGDPVPAELSRVDAIPGFLAQATRPDGLIEALGDSSPTPLGARDWVGTPAEWQATGGASGVPPSATFSAYAGGYVFGRSGWGTADRPLIDETYYSVRAGRADGIPHAHDDAGSVTLYSHGTPLLLDTGQWKYLYGSTRSFIVSRAAHNVVLVDNVHRSNPRPDLRTTQVDGLDISTVVDRGYRGVTLTRTVAYDRVDDVLLVWDRLESPRKVTASQQWGLARDRGVRLDADAAHSTGAGANVSMYFTSGGAPLDVAKGQRGPMRGWNSEAYGDLAPSPSVRATQRGTSLSWLTVIAPRGDGVPASAYSATSTVSPVAASVVLTTPTGASTVNLDAANGSRTAATVLTPQVDAASPIVLAGTSTKLRGRGLEPGTPVTVESLPANSTVWAPVTTVTASAAGTAETQVSVPTTADYRVVSGSGAASAPVRVTAAVAPQPPTGVVATPSGKGKVTVTWTPPSDTGGAPLTTYVVWVADRRVVVPADQTSAEVSGIVPGSRVAKVRAFNAVAHSTWSRATVDVPAYPALHGPARARKGATVRLTLTGLLPEQPTSVAIRTVSSGAVRTVQVRPMADGTGALRFRVQSTVRVVATSGGVRSGAVRIVVPKRR